MVKKEKQYNSLTAVSYLVKLSLQLNFQKPGKKTIRTVNYQGKQNYLTPFFPFLAFASASELSK